MHAACTDLKQAALQVSNQSRVMDASHRQQAVKGHKYCLGGALCSHMAEAVQLLHCLCVLQRLPTAHLHVTPRLAGTLQSLQQIVM